MKIKIFAIIVVFIFLVIGLSGCLYEIDKEIKDNIEEFNLIEVVLDIEALSQENFGGKIVPDAGIEIRFTVIKEGVVVYNNTHLTDSSGIAGAIVDFNIFPKEKITITADREHYSGKSATKEFNYQYFKSKASIVEPKDRCVELVKMTLPIV